MNVTRFGVPFSCAAIAVLMVSVGAQTRGTESLDLRQELRLVRTLDTPLDKYSHVYFDANGRNVIVANIGENQFRDPKTLELERNIKACGGSDFGSSVREGFNRLMTAGCVKSGITEVWSIPTSQMVRKFEIAVQRELWRFDTVISILSPDERRVAIYDPHSEPTELWDIEAGKRIATLTPTLNRSGARDADAALFSPDSRILAVSVNGSIYLWDAETGKMLFRLSDGNARDSANNGFSSHRHIVYALLYSHDSKFLFTGSLDREVKQWEVATGKLVRTFSGHSDRIETMSLSPDGRLLATGSRDKKLKLWDLRTGRLMWTSPSHSSRVWQIYFGPDGSRILTMTGSSGNIGSENETRMWDTATGQLLGRMPSKWQQSSFSPDWRYFVTVGKKKNTIELYRFGEKVIL